MEIKIKETNEMSTITIIDAKTGCDWSSDLIGEWADSDITEYIDGTPIMTQEAFNWWLNHAEERENADNMLNEFDYDDQREILTIMGDIEFNEQPSALIAAIEEFKNKEDTVNINFLGKEQINQDETTRYWFDVDGIGYCIADNSGDLALLDHEGYPIEDCNDHDGIKALLIPEYEKHIMDMDCNI